jgi:hypothetical protein
MSLHVLGSKATFAAWQEVPIGYIYCLNDGINTYSSQLEQVEMMKKDMGRNIVEFKCDAGHHPNITCPDEVVRFLRIFVGELEDD